MIDQNEKRKDERRQNKGGSGYKAMFIIMRTIVMPIMLIPLKVITS